MAGVVVAWLGPETALSMIAVAYAGAAICLSFVPLLPGLGTISGKIAKDLFEIVWQEGASPAPSSKRAA
jgi:hypothetical protein